MASRVLVFFSKILIKVLRLAGKNGSALPGLIIEHIYPKFLEKTLRAVQRKIIIVTGTNGKTTTSKMLTTALRGAGKTVITNNTGSNMTRGLISTLVENMSYLGRLKSADWFIFEMDEAYAPLFTKSVNPRAVLSLNVLRDQLDRYGEIDKTASLIKHAASYAEVFIYNALDPLLSESANDLKDKIEVYSFSVAPGLVSHIENEQSLHNKRVEFIKRDDTNATLEAIADVDSMQRLTVKSGTTSDSLDFLVPIEGFFNAMNATATVSTLSIICKPNELEMAVSSLAKMEPPFGRGERLILRDKIVTVALVKNPSGFMSNLETFIKDKPVDTLLFVVNDRFADGRDVSWLWDVNFKEMIHTSDKSEVITSGSRAYDMALRLKYDNIDAKVTTNVAQAINSLMQSEHKNITIIPTYTALFEVRTNLSRYGKVPRIW